MNTAAWFMWVLLGAGVCFTPPTAFGYEESVRPGVNARFVAPNLNVERWLRVFEGESREIYRHRRDIVEQLDLAPGMSVADVGAGTGLFLGLIAGKVGLRGKVYAVEIAPRFIEYLQERVRRQGWTQVEVVEGKTNSAELPPNSVDVAFLCDTYHHFEYPRSMLASLRVALRPGGYLVIVDFERLPGISRKWVLGHVRAGKNFVIAEIEAAGFILSDNVEIPGLRENYMLQFLRPVGDLLPPDELEGAAAQSSTGAARPLYRHRRCRFAGWGEAA